MFMMVREREQAEMFKQEAEIKKKKYKIGHIFIACRWYEQVNSILITALIYKFTLIKCVLQHQGI